MNAEVSAIRTASLLRAHADGVRITRGSPECAKQLVQLSQTTDKIAVQLSEVRAKAVAENYADILELLDQNIE
jgi:hypothetical protein